MSIKKEFNIYALSTDPIYIGTGGYTIGRVDNTIVRDPITKIPKIPGSSVAGTWRYYTILDLHGFFMKNFNELNEILNQDNIAKGKDVRELVNRLADKELDEIGENKKEFDNRKEKFQEYSKKLIKDLKKVEEWKLYWGNLISSIKCAGQDDKPNTDIEDTDYKELHDTGHCGHCIVCKTFGFSKNEKSQQGLAFFSDLNILFFPVSTRFGVRWITSPSILRSAGLGKEIKDIDLLKDEILLYDDKSEYKFLNLGWLNFKVKGRNLKNKINIPEKIDSIEIDKLVLVSDDIISQIINANLEVRTSVSINPLTGAAKEGALFTSEAIPRGTVFYGNVRIMDRLTEEEDLNSNSIKNALKESKKYYESFGIGGLVTRGFGRLKIYFEE